MGAESVKDDIKAWLSDAFKEEHFQSIKVDISGTSEKGDGYVGDIYFVQTTAVRANGETKLYNLVVKVGKTSETLRDKMPIRLAFEREVFVYAQVVPTFRKFEVEHNVKIIDSVLPKCFGTLLYDKQELLVFQNLKAIGYDLHDRHEPLDMTHLKITLTNYGKLHGLSMAFRDQKPEEFNKLFGQLDCVLTAFITTIAETMPKMEQGMYAVLESSNEVKLAERLKGHFKEGFANTLKDFLQNSEENCVLVHGDCWNNNMMFKYVKSVPQEVCFLDFQLSKLGSPVADLAYHLYSTCSETQLIHFKELLQKYHNSLSQTILSLGSDPEKLFPYSELVRQWKKYSIFGVIMCAIGLPIILSDKEDAIDIQDMDSEVIDEILEKGRQKNNDRLSPRIVAVVRHFLEQC